MTQGVPKRLVYEHVGYMRWCPVCKAESVRVTRAPTLDDPTEEWRCLRCPHNRVQRVEIIGRAKRGDL